MPLILMISRDYTKKFIELIEKERNEEMKTHKSEISKISGSEREKKGKALINLCAKKIKKRDSIRYKLFKKDKNLPFTKIGQGDVILVSKRGPLKDGVSSTALEVNKKYIIVEFKTSQVMIDKAIKSDDRVRIDLYINDTTYQRMIESLNYFDRKRVNLKDIILLKRKPELDFKKDTSHIESLSFFSLLNESQKLALINSEKEKELFFIQGPPGTGKTQVAAGIIISNINQNKKILVTAESNNAVDNLLRRTYSMMKNYKEGDLVRLGHPSRINDKLKKFSLNYLEDKNKSLEEKNITKRIEKLIDKRESYIKPTKAKRNGLSNFQIKKFAEREQEFGNIDKKTMESMADWIRTHQKISALIKKKNKKFSKKDKKIIDNAKVVFSTNSSSHTLIEKDKNIDFDLLISDEASQAMEPSSLIPINFSKKAIFIGDHKQLPPTIMGDNELSNSLFERLFGKVRYVLLDTQYRMNDKIMQFSNKEFYHSKLKSSEKIKDITLKKNIFKSPIVMIDLDSKEDTFKSSNSYYNKKEAEKSIKLCEKYIDLGYKDIGIITPYVDQIRYILKNLDKKTSEIIEVDSVDGFQGREKEIIIMSLVRSNEKNNIGFLQDLRRLNVGLTRAKKQLIVICNTDTIKGDETYNRLIKYFKKNGEFIEK
ncbi:MAG: IGHMBP2 family helicase [Candidatus Woesearchaeota archaeon]